MNKLKEVINKINPNFVNIFEDDYEWIDGQNYIE